MNISFTHRAGRVSLSALIACAVCLLIGAVAGSLITQQIMLRKMQTMLSDREQYPHLITARIDTAVDLRPEQAEKITRIIDEDLKRVWATTDMFWPFTRAQINRTAEEIRAVLDDPQRAEFDRKYKAFMQHLDEMMTRESE